MKIQLENISINDYAKMLRAGVEVELIQDIETELNSALGGISGGFDIALFMLQKDLLIFQTKFNNLITDRKLLVGEMIISKCMCEIHKLEYIHDETKLNEIDSKIELWNKKITELQEQIAKKTVKKEKGNPYQSFLAWILAVEKFLSFAIDKNNDLLYFVEATKQMINYYEQQKKSIEEQNAKRK